MPLRATPGPDGLPRVTVCPPGPADHDLDSRYTARPRGESLVYGTSRAPRADDPDAWEHLYGADEDR